MTDSRRDGGFTLIEVLVALVIVAFGMGALMATLTSAATSVDHLRDKSFAEWVALNRISEVRLGKAAPDDGKTSGESELGGQRWRWTQTITRSGLPNTIQIDVSVARATAKTDDKATQIAVATGFKGLQGTLTNNNGVEPDWSLETVAAQAPPGGAANPGAPGNGSGTPATSTPPPQPPPGSSPESRR